MTLKEHINSFSRKPAKSPRAKEIERIARKMHSTPQTVYNWMRGSVEIPWYAKENLKRLIKGLDI